MHGRRRALLVWHQLDKIRDIVLHPAAGLMFWSDWGNRPVIEVAAMDGTQRRALVTENLKFPNGLAIDAQLDRLYFVDGGTKTLEYVRLDGTGRTRVITDGMRHPFGVDVHAARVYWTDWDTQRVDVADATAGTGRRALLNGTSDLMDVRVFHRRRVPVANPCARQNGGCQHMCLLRPGDVPACVCPVGVRPLNDRQCPRGPARYVLLAHRIDVRMVSLDIDYVVDVILPLPAVTNAVALDVDRTNGDVYWSDTVEDTIVRADQSGAGVRTVVSDSLDNVDGLAVDSVGRKLYWTDGGRHTVEVAELDGSSRSVLVWQFLDNPRGIALDYEAGLMFWSDWGAQPKLERAQMDGSERRRVVDSGLMWPNGVAADALERRLYWVDAQKKRLESCDYEGGKRRVVVQELSYPYGVAVQAGNLYWTDWNTTGLHRLRQQQSDGPQEPEVLLSGLQGLMDVKVVDVSLARCLLNAQFVWHK